MINELWIMRAICVALCSIIAIGLVAIRPYRRELKLVKEKLKKSEAESTRLLDIALKSAIDHRETIEEFRGLIK